MREKETPALQGYKLQELAIDSISYSPWDNMSSSSVVFSKEDSGLDVLTSGDPCTNEVDRSTTSIKAFLSASVWDHDLDEVSKVKGNEPQQKGREFKVSTSSSLDSSTSAFSHTRHHFDNNMMSSSDFSNGNGHQLTASPHIFTLPSSKTITDSSLPSPTKLLSSGSTQIKEKNIFQKLNAKSRGKLLLFGNKGKHDRVKAVQFQSFFNKDNDVRVNGSGVLRDAGPSNFNASRIKHSSANKEKHPGEERCTPHEKTSALETVNTRSELKVKTMSDKSLTATSFVEDNGEDESEVTVTTGLCRCANLSTQRGRRNHALLIMLVSVIPILALVIQNSIGVYEHSTELSQHDMVRGEILFSVEIGNVLHRTQIERGTTALYVSSKGNRTILQNLTAAYKETDKAISSLTKWVIEPSIDHFQSVQLYHQRIIEFRNQVLSSVVPNVPIPEVIKFYSDDNAIIVRWVGQFIQHSKSGDLWKALVGYYMLILSKEQAGVERALGSTFYAKGGYSDQEMLEYLERKILGLTYLERCTEFSPTVNALLKNVFYGKETDINLQRMREEILSNDLNGSDVAMGAQWFNNMTKYINILKISGVKWN